MTLSRRNDERLLKVAKRARRWFDQDIAGTALNGPQDEICIARDLSDIIMAIDEDHWFADHITVLQQMRDGR